MKLATSSKTLGKLPFFDNSPERPASRFDFRPLQRFLPSIIFADEVYGDRFEGDTGFPGLRVLNPGSGRWLGYSRDGFRFVLSPEHSSWHVVSVEYGGSIIWGVDGKRYDDERPRKPRIERGPIWAKMREVIGATAVEAETWNKNWIGEHGKPKEHPSTDRFIDYSAY